jgi:predicted MPP superfamily phosphohydrolase
MLESLRRLLLSRLVFNLAAALGLAQVLVCHWALVVAAGGESPGPGPLGATALGLVVANSLVAAPLRRARFRHDALARVARLYMELGVATLLVGTAVALSWLIFLLAAGLLGAVGARPETAFAAFRLASLLLVGGTALAALWGYTGGQARVALTRLRVPVDGLAAALDGLRVVQISDLHIGNALDGERLSRMLARTNAVDPDVLVLTGDLFDFDPSALEDGARRLGALRARHGVYAILGNHDAYLGADRVADALARYAPSIRLLRDEIVRLPLQEPLYLAGIEDPGRRPWFDRGLRYARLDAVAKRRCGDGPTLLLLHQPEAFAHAAELGFPLVLCGHTHGGQIALPTRRGQLNLSRLMTPLTRGLYRRGGSTLYVNRGLGVGGPALRIHCDREIATLELVAPGPCPRMDTPTAHSTA